MQTSTRFVVSATTRDSSPEPVEIPHTRQVVADEETAKRIVVARNRQEQVSGAGSMVWGYYQEDVDSRPWPTPDLPLNWDDCTKPQLEWLRDNGSYMQRKTAENHLREIAAKEKAWL